MLTVWFGGTGYLKIAVIKEFRMTHCTEHFSEYLACMDRVIWVGDFIYIFCAIFVLFCFVEALRLD